MGKGKAQGAIASHGYPADGSPFATGTNAISCLNVRDELTQKKITVANCAVGRVDVKTAPAFGRDDEKVSYFAPMFQIIEQRPPTAVEQGLLVIAEPMKKIEHRISELGLLRRCRIIACWHIDAVMDFNLENIAVECIAIDPALRVR